MKSPWKLLAQFLRQRRSAETRESSVGRDQDTERSESKLQHLLDPPLDATEDPHGSEHEEAGPTEFATSSTSDQVGLEINAAPEVAMPDEVEELHAPTRRQSVGSTVQAHAPRVVGGANKMSRRTPPTRKLDAKTTRADTIAPSAAAASSNKSSQRSPPRDAFLAEVAGLDKDIKQLRNHLARKLHLQNVQLKKMLERFDLS